MNFQKKSYAKLALGSPGDILKGYHNNCSTWWGYTADANVKAGGFVQTKANPTNENEIIGASGKAITGTILGVATKNTFISSCNEATTTFPQNNNVEYLSVGTIVVGAESQVAKKGQYVFLKNDTGAIAFDDNATKSGYTLTKFRVLIGNSKTEAGVVAITTDL
ncbi:hypothetical protein [Campylobacter sp.]|uniref:structural cement protein Gp24 n=1 Tax=Campylobacter sp. TaxID=205 RepID=UPI0025C3AF8D|nr:hypothetical protein [Campylobacter sp.]